jgi:UDP-glucose 4-epimerase/UDP-glucuronate decarboxylase
VSATLRRILLTGGAGFIGIHLAQRLAGDDAVELTIADDFSRGARDDDIRALADMRNVRLETVDLTDAATWRRLGNGYDEVYHLAAMIGVKHVLARPQEVIRVNALSTLHLLDWFVGGGGDKVLFSSTSEVYAWTQQFHALAVPTPEDVPLSLTNLGDPRSSYAGSKIFGELAVNRHCLAHGKRYVVVRYHNVYGPRMGQEHVIPELFERLLAGEDPLAVYSADHTRAFCYVSDAVDATIAAMREPRADGQTINVGNDSEEIRIADLASRLIARAGCDVGIEPRTAANDPILRRCPDLSRARELLGYEPKITLDEGLDRTLKWYEPRLRARFADPPAAPRV